MQSLLQPSLGRILLAPWHRRRNQGSLWTLGLVAAFLVLPPLGLVALAGWAGNGVPPPHHILFIVSWVFLMIGVAGAWTAIVANLFAQNHPALARLVPGHVEGLRRALFVTWGVLVAVAGLLPGLVIGQPLALLSGVAVALAVVAVWVRWPIAALVWVVLPIALSRMPPRPDLLRDLLAVWRPHAAGWTALALALSVALLLGVMPGSDRRHAAAWTARRDRGLRASARQLGTAGIDPRASRFGTIAVAPYFWWLDRQLARPGTAVGSRLALGLGPSQHWTMRLSTMLWTTVGFGAGAALGGSLVRDVGLGVLSGASLGALFAIVVPSLQVRAGLWQTRREQGLLLLLPGVPRHGTLNHWLGLRLTLNYAISLAGGLAVSWGMRTLADLLVPGGTFHPLDESAILVSAALMPLAPLVWRRWDRMSAPSGFTAFATMLVPVALVALLAVGRWKTGLGLAPLTGACVAVSLLWCALRWRRAADEPEHLPFGRGAR